MKNLVIIHFSPVELYPPIMNLLNNISVDNLKVSVISSSMYRSSINRLESNFPKINFIRIGKSGSGMRPFHRWINFIYFYISAFFYLIFNRPSKVLYFETLSSFPALIYKRYFNKQSDLFIHYHEYTSPEEYKTGSKLLRFFHKIERSMFISANWISHINDHRLHQFMQDNSILPLSNTKALPNYPPASWTTISEKININVPVRLVYVGSIGMDMMYTEAFARWVKSKNGAVVWDIYSANLNPKVTSFFNNLSAENIHFKGYADYFSLPEILKQYDAGIILYRGDIPNHLYVTPNKLFEYHSCGLDVWFPDKLVSCLSLRTQNTYPKICSIDFDQLAEVNINQLADRSGYQLLNQKFSCEEVLQDLCNELEK